MKNPLNKRIFSEIKCDKGRYIAIFLFLILAIGFISGFIIADSSMIEEVNKSDEKYNIENGNFEIYGNTVTSLRMRNRKKNAPIPAYFFATAMGATSVISNVTNSFSVGAAIISSSTTRSCSGVFGICRSKKSISTVTLLSNSVSE